MIITINTNKLFIILQIIFQLIQFVRHSKTDPFVRLRGIADQVFGRVYFTARFATFEIVVEYFRNSRRYRHMYRDCCRIPIATLYSRRKSKTALGRWIQNTTTLYDDVDYPMKFRFYTLIDTRTRLTIVHVLSIQMTLNNFFVNINRHIN